MKFVIALTLIGCLSIPSLSLAATGTWMDTVGTGGSNFYSNTSVNQTPGATYSSNSTGVPNGVNQYTPLEPLNASGKYINFADYLGTVYKLFITIGSLVAIVMLVTGGIRYMLSESFTDIDKAKKRIISALWGLTILVGSFLILYTINPNLLNFNLALSNVSQTSSNYAPPTSNTTNYAQSSIITPVQFNSQDASNATTINQTSDFTVLCSRSGGFVVRQPGSDGNTTVDTCQPSGNAFTPF